MKKIFLIGITIFQFLPCITQENPFVFKRFSTQNGLSDNWVRCIYQDDSDYLWFGTADGLNRFDGYEFKVYRPLNSENQSLGDIHINAIDRKNDHELWVCTDAGAFSFNFRNDGYSFNAILSTLSVLCILPENEENIWFGTGWGLYRYNQTDSSIVSFQYNGMETSSISSNYINTIYKDSESNIWIGTKNGLNLYDRKNESFTRFQNSDNPESISGNDVMSICEDHSKRIWIGTAQNGLNLVLKNKSDEISFRKIYSGYIVNLLVDYQNYLWICKSSGEGLVRVQLDKFSLEKDIQVEIFQHDPIHVKSLSDNSVFCIYEDNTKDIWVGTFGGGINYYSKREKQFHTVQVNYSGDNSIQNNLINAICEDENYLWIGTEGGLDRYEKGGKQFKHFQYEANDPASLSANPVYAIYKDRRENLWIGTWSGGLNLYNPQSETFKHYLTGTERGITGAGNVFSIFEDSRGNLWIGTIGGGLVCFDHKKESFIQYTHSEIDSTSLFRDFVNHIYESSTGMLYVSTYLSLDIFNYKEGNFTHCILQPDNYGTKVQIISIFEDSRQNIWIATNNGLVLFDERTREFTSYPTGNIFPDNTIQGILEDSHGNLWISTNHGIVQLMDGIHLPSQPLFRSFNTIDGLPGNEFNKRAVFKKNSGIMYFGSSQGYTFFHPDSITFNSIPPKIVLTDFQLLFIQPEESNKYQSINQNINETDQLELSYKNSSFIIQFSALNYLNPEKNQYQYKLEGYDKNWIDAGSSRSATYTNINPGKYKFFVKGSNNDGIWCETSKQLTIIIRPPWWRTLFFKIGLLAVILLLSLLLHFARISFLKKQNLYLEQKVKERTNELSEINTLLEEKQEEITTQNNELQHHRNNLEQIVEDRTSELVKAKVRAEESDRLKSSFLANISHEIRTPMNAIYGFSGVLTDENLSNEKRNRYLDIINKNCESLLVLIDDIIDISLIEADHLDIKNTHFEVNPVLIKLKQIFQLKNSNCLDFEFVNQKDKEKLILFGDKVRFHQILSNLLSNAFKYTESGQIKFGYDEFRTHVRFYVSDTGIGIEETEVDNIFNQFYKVENNPNKLYRGTGIGLAISKKMVELMGGEIWVESQMGGGSVFFFTLPKLIQDSKLVKPVHTIKKNKLRLKNITLLIAEDDPTSFELIKIMLKSFGATIIRAQNGREAIEYVKNRQDTTKCLVLMDIKMPVMDGYEATQKIKKINDKIPVIAVTAYAQKTDKRKILQSGFDDYISKPIKLEILLAALSKFT